jgi:CRP-like cAMP-binding protein
MSIPAALLKRLTNLSVFEGLTPAETAEFFEVALEQKLEAGHVLFREDDEGDALYVVLSGQVTVMKRNVELARVSAPAAVGEMSLVGPGDRRSATVQAVNESVVLKIPSKRVQKMLKADSLAALKVVANLAGVLAQRLAAINDRLVLTDGSRRSPKREELAEFASILNRWSFDR